MPNRCTHLAYANVNCENCGEEVKKGSALIIEEDTPFCSDICADKYFERTEYGSMDDEDPYHEVARENTEAEMDRIRQSDSIRESDEQERRNH